MPTDTRRNKLDKMVVVTTAGALPAASRSRRSPVVGLGEPQGHAERLDWPWYPELRLPNSTHAYTLREPSCEWFSFRFRGNAEVSLR